MKHQVLRLFAIMLAIALAAAACGSDDGADTAAPPLNASDEGESSVEDDDTAAGGAISREDAAEQLESASEVTDGGVETASLDELEARWAAGRAAVVADIEANGYGLDGGHSARARRLDRRPQSVSRRLEQHRWHR